MNHFFIKVMIAFCSVAVFGLHNALLQAQPKMIAEGTITYSVNIAGNSRKEETVKRLYIKGRKTRSEISNASFYQATIFDNRTGEATVLKEIGKDKYLSQFSADKWKEKNNRWVDATVEMTNDTKKILNYNCRKAVMTVKDGSRFTIFFTTDYIVSATENPFQFKDIPGLILEYDTQNREGQSVEITAVDVNFSPVLAAKFAIPTVGYRIM